MKNYLVVIYAKDGVTELYSATVTAWASGVAESVARADLLSKAKYLPKKLRSLTSELEWVVESCEI